MASLLLPGHNVVAVEAVNTVPGPAGLLVKLAVQLTDGFTVVLVSDGTWKASDKQEPNWQLASFDDNPWAAATVVAELGDKPWAKVAATDALEPAGELPNKISELAERLLRQAARRRRSGRPRATCRRPGLAAR